MPMVRVPHSGDNEGFSVISEGVYDIKVTNTEVRQPNKQGDPMKLMVQGEIKGSSNGKHADRKVTLWFRFDQAWKLEHLLKATDVPFEMIEGPQGSGQQMAFDSDHLLGKFFQARLTHNADQKGKIWENWTYIEPSPLSNGPQGGQGVQPAPAQMPSPPVMPGQQGQAQPPVQQPVVQQAAPAQAPAQQPPAQPQVTQAQPPVQQPPVQQPPVEQPPVQQPQGQVPPMPTVPGQS